MDHSAASGGVRRPEPVDRRPVLAVHALPGDLEAGLNLEYVLAHLDGYRHVSADEAASDQPASAAVVVGDADGCARLMNRGVPTVYVHPAGSVTDGRTAGLVPADIVCRQVPGWLARAAGRPPGKEIRVAALAPFRQVRSTRGSGVAVQLTGYTGFAEDSWEADTAEALRAALRAAGVPTGQAVPVLTDLPLSRWQPLASRLAQWAPVSVPAERWSVVLRRADALLATPTVLATTFARFSGVPLHLLAPEGSRQRQVYEALAAPAADGEGAEPPSMLTVGPHDWPGSEGRAGSLGGAAQVARQVRQLCFAPT